MNDLRPLLERAASRGKKQDPYVIFAEALSVVIAEATPAAPSQRSERLAVASGEEVAPSRVPEPRSGSFGRAAVAAAAVVAVVVGAIVAERVSMSERGVTTVWYGTPDPTVLSPVAPAPTPEVSPPEASSPPTTQQELECASEFPLPLTLPGFAGPFPGKSPDSPLDPRPGQLVQHWTLGEETYEMRWPDDGPLSLEEKQIVKERVLESPKRGTGIGFGNSTNLLGYGPPCTTVSIKMFSPTIEQAEALAARVDAHIAAALKAYNKASIPFVVSTSEKPAPPEVVPCRPMPQVTVAEPVRRRTVSSAPVAPSPREALRQFLEADQVGEWFYAGFTEYVMSNDQYAYSAGVLPDGAGVVVWAELSPPGWSVTRYAISGC